MAREVSESCMDSLLTEIVSSYCNVLYVSKPELAARRIEAIGYQVGHQLSERYTMERPRFSDHLEAIKFICKDFWSELFKKQIDNLKTNHRGTFVLQDDKFAWVSRMSSTENSGSTQEPGIGNKAAEASSMHLYFQPPCLFICDPDKGVVNISVTVRARFFGHPEETIPRQLCIVLKVVLKLSSDNIWPIAKYNEDVHEYIK
ncbi:unnamed protein product [Lactuca virosa]|uniref:Trafficking protein particle complex subunit n=1 Tax=Lactuca virosa TaxID=75947 RepID=A0AAU9P3S6_9ASTR|nr:unnamed protein product [Lactuca virosa]